MSDTHALREYQTYALFLLRQSYASGFKRPLLQLATGGGKTRIATEIIKSAVAKDRRVAFIVDRLQLVQQACDALDHAGLDHGVIQGQHERMDRDKPVQVISIHTMARRKWWEFGLGIVDECHVRNRTLSKLMSAWDAVPMIGLSATPWTAGLGLLWDDLIVPISIEELIAQGYLVEADVYSPSKANLDDVQVLAGEFNMKQAEARMRLVGDIPHHWHKMAKGRRTLIMASSVEHSKSLVEAFSAAGIDSRHIDAYTDGEIRQRYIADFRAGKVKVLSSVGTLITGFDAPEAEVLVIARPTKSRMLHCQMVGRVLRPSPGTAKTRALILDHAGNFERLGFHTDPVPLVLDDSKNGFAKSVCEPAKEKLPSTCPNCHAVRPPGYAVCLICGHSTIRGKKPKVEKGSLTLLKPTAAEKHYLAETPTQRAEFLAGLRHVAMQRGYKPGWVHFAYLKRYGKKPDSHMPDLGTAQPNEVVLKYVTSLDIAARHALRGK
jgi:superfamily II DNA or RNA helicase